MPCGSGCISDRPALTAGIRIIAKNKQMSWLAATTGMVSGRVVRRKDGWNKYPEQWAT
jgi:hypothetical protein